jgi:putative spermidine/putrescine transport system permease protein
VNARLATGLARGALTIVVVAVLLFLTVPTAVVVLASFNTEAALNFPPRGLSLRWYGNLAARPDFWRGLVNTLVVAVVASALALGVATGAAVVLQRRPFRGSALLTAALLSPLVIPGVLVGVGLLFLSVQVSLVASLPILLLAHTIMVVPFALRSVWTSLEQLDPTLERAAEVLGARPRQAFLWVILPLLRPGLVAALLFSLIMSMNEFAVSLFVVGRATQTLPVVLFNYTMAYVDPTIAAASTLFVLGTLVAIGAVELAVGLPRVLRLEESR